MTLETAQVESTEELATKLAHFEREGWAIFEDVFDPERDFAPLFEDFERIANRLADEELTPEQREAWPPDGDLNAKLIHLAEYGGEIDGSPFDPSIRPTTVGTADRDPLPGQARLRSPAPSAAARRGRAVCRSRDLFLSDPARADQGSRAIPGSGRRAGPRDPVASRPRGAVTRGRRHRDDHGVGGPERRHGGRRVLEDRSRQPSPGIGAALPQPGERRPPSRTA